MSQVLEINTGQTISERTKKPQKVYWTEDTENAIKEYLALDFNHLSMKLETYIENIQKRTGPDVTIDDGYIADLQDRIDHSMNDSNIFNKEILFRKKIKAPLNKLIENIIYSFKLFRDDIDVKTVHNDCMAHVYEKFYKFDPDEGTKSFSYFGTIAKHYLQNKKKDLYISKTINLNYDDMKEEVDDMNGYSIDEIKEEDQTINLFYFITNSFEKNINNKILNENDKKVLFTIVDLFKTHQDSFDNDKYNKTNIHDHIREYSKLTKEDVSKSLTKLRNLYKDKKKDFFNKGQKK